MSSPQGSVLRAGLLAGLVGTVLFATPFLGKLNYCCCALVLACGAFAAWMLRSDSAGSASTARCGMAGALSGVVVAVLGIPLRAFLSRIAFGTAYLEARITEWLDAWRQGAEQSGQPMPPGFIEAFESGLRATGGLELNAWLLVAVFFCTFIHAFFGLLGGFAGALVTQRPVPPAPPVGAEAPVPAEATATANPQAPPVEPAWNEPEPAPPVVDDQGRPDVRWDGPQLEPADEPPADPGDVPSSEGASTGDIPADELPLLPARDLPPDEPPERQA